MLSGAIDVAPQLSLLCQASYGRGMANFINDLNGYGYDLIPTSTPDDSPHPVHSHSK